jgi:hypothetical protein
MTGTFPPGRGTKPHKHVWIAHCKIPHDNGHMEKFICGVFADRELAARVLRSEGTWQGHGPFTESRYTDGDIYLYDKTGHQRYIIQRHKVEIDGSSYHQA